jgi:hypothetical protein
MSEDFEAVPMSGENLPLKDMETPPPDLEGPVKVVKSNSKLMILLIILVVLALIGGIYLGFNLNRAKPIPELSPSVFVSPGPTPTSTPEPQNLEEKIDKLHSDLEDLDLKESNMLPPSLDYKIRFKIK